MTGEKINKLRKSYEGKVRDLGLEGRNKAAPKEGILEGLVDPEWDTDFNGDGRTRFQNERAEYMLGEHDVDDLMGKLGKAFDLKPGRVPGKEGAEWRDMLGLDQAATTAAKPNTNGPALSGTTPLSTKPTAATLLAKTAPVTAATAMRSSAPASPRGFAARPERAGKKRRYDESSYTGYQEGYEDDGYSTGGIDDAGRRGSASKRQKRKVSGRVSGFYRQIADE